MDETWGTPALPRAWLGSPSFVTGLPGSRAPASRLAALPSSRVAPLRAPPPPCQPGADDPLPDPAPHCRGLFLWPAGTLPRSGREVDTPSGADGQPVSECSAVDGILLPAGNGKETHGGS